MNGSNGDATSDDASSGASGGGGGSSGTTLKKGPWTAAEDAILLEYVKKHGEGNWNAVQKNSGLSRCGKSCRLRWANHLRPNLKKGSFSPDEERLILELHAKLGNKWARMAAQLPGRTDNEIKNYWNTRVKRRQRAGLPLYPHDIQKQAAAFHHHHHHHHQSHPSPSPSPPTHLSSTQQPKPNFMSASLSPFDPISFSTNNNPHLSHHGTPFLSTPIHHQFKRFRDNNSTTNNLGFSLPFSPPPPPPPSSLLSQSLSIQLPTPSSFQFNPGNFDLNPPSIPPSTNFSMKLELPSSQLPQAPAIAAASGSPNEFTQPLGRNNSGLLDALLQEAQTMASNHEDTRREGLLASQEQKCGLDGMVSDAPPSGSVFSESTTSPLSATTPPPLVSTNQWDDLSSARSSLGAKTKKEPRDEINSVDDELSGFLDVIPSTMSVCEWYSDSGEMSNGQSSGMTDDDIGLEMQHLASSLSVTTTSDHEWTLGSSWNNMPGIC